MDSCIFISLCAIVMLNINALPLARNKRDSKSLINGDKSCDRCEILGEMCQNGGTCVTEDCTMRCICRDGFSGMHCGDNDSPPVRRKRKQFGGVIMSLFRTLGKKKNEDKELKNGDNGHNGKSGDHGNNGKAENNSQNSKNSENGNKGNNEDNSQNGNSGDNVHNGKNRDNGHNERNGELGNDRKNGDNSKTGKTDGRGNKGNNGDNSYNGSSGENNGKNGDNGSNGKGDVPSNNENIGDKGQNSKNDGRGNKGKNEDNSQNKSSRDNGQNEQNGDNTHTVKNRNNDQNGDNGHNGNNGESQYLSNERGDKKSRNKDVTNNEQHGVIQRKILPKDTNRTSGNNKQKNNSHSPDEIDSDRKGQKIVHPTQTTSQNIHGTDVGIQSSTLQMNNKDQNGQMSNSRPKTKIFNIQEVKEIFDNQAHDTILTKESRPDGKSLNINGRAKKPNKNIHGIQTNMSGSIGINATKAGSVEHDTEKVNKQTQIKDKGKVNDATNATKPNKNNTFVELLQDSITIRGSERETVFSKQRVTKENMPVVQPESKLEMSVKSNSKSNVTISNPNKTLPDISKTTQENLKGIPNINNNNSKISTETIQSKVTHKENTKSNENVKSTKIENQKSGNKEQEAERPSVIKMTTDKASAKHDNDSDSTESGFTLSKAETQKVINNIGLGKSSSSEIVSKTNFNHASPASTNITSHVKDKSNVTNRVQEKSNITPNVVKKDQSRWSASSLHPISSGFKERNTLEIPENDQISDKGRIKDASIDTTLSRSIQKKISLSTIPDASPKSVDTLSNIHSTSAKNDKSILNVIGILSKIIQTLKNQTTNANPKPTERIPLVSSKFPLLPDPSLEYLQTNVADITTVATSNKDRSNRIQEESDNAMKNKGRGKSKLAASIYGKFSPLAGGIKSDPKITTPQTPAALNLPALQEIFASHKSDTRRKASGLTKSLGDNSSDSNGIKTSISKTDTTGNSEDIVNGNDQTNKQDTLHRLSVLETHSLKESLLKSSTTKAKVEQFNKSRLAKAKPKSDITLKVNETDWLMSNHTENEALEPLISVNLIEKNTTALPSENTTSTDEIKLNRSVEKFTDVINNQAIDVEVSFSNETNTSTPLSRESATSSSTKPTTGKSKTKIQPITATSPAPSSIISTLPTTSSTTLTMASLSSTSHGSVTSPTTPLTAVTTSLSTTTVPSTITTTQKTTTVPAADFTSTVTNVLNTDNELTDDVGPALLFKRLIEREKNEVKSTTVIDDLQSLKELHEVSTTSTSEMVVKNFSQTNVAQQLSSPIKEILAKNQISNVFESINVEAESYTQTPNSTTVQSPTSINSNNELSTSKLEITTTSLKLISHQSVKMKSSIKLKRGKSLKKVKDMEDYSIAESHRFLEPGGNDLIDTTTTLKPYTKSYSSSTEASADTIKHERTKSALGKQISKTKEKFKQFGSGLVEDTTNNVLQRTEQIQTTKNYRLQTKKNV